MSGEILRDMGVKFWKARAALSLTRCCIAQAARGKMYNF
jgi:hypothetical protein